MKAISIRQPWANKIASGEKAVETRSWPTDHRGELLIVSSKRPPIPPAGCALAIVRVVDCRPITRSDGSPAYSWELELVRRLLPFPVRGKLGLYDVEIPPEA